jgi:hypothetical protein
VNARCFGALAAEKAGLLPALANVAFAHRMYSRARAAPTGLDERVPLACDAIGLALVAQPGRSLAPRQLGELLGRIVLCRLRCRFTTRMVRYGEFLGRLTATYLYELCITGYKTWVKDGK